jgi:hypothetical protein
MRSDNSKLEPREAARGGREEGLEVLEGLAALTAVVTASTGQVAFQEPVAHLNLQQAGVGWEGVPAVSEAEGAGSDKIMESSLHYSKPAIHDTRNTIEHPSSTSFQCLILLS